jgi:hypothetical protein
MVVPLPTLAPVIEPVIVPTVQVKLLGELAVKVILGPVPLQVLAVAELVIAGLGLTFINTIPEILVVLQDVTILLNQVSCVSIPEV